MVRTGNWDVELVDGSGTDRHCEIDGAIKLGAGDIIPGTLYGRRWVIERVDVDARAALAVPDDE